MAKDKPSDAPAQPTIRDVARAAAVSTATVSATINGTAYVSPALQERVWAAVERVGYQPDAVARSLRKGVTRMLGLLLADITNPFTTAVVQSMEATAHARGYALMLCNSDEDRAREETHLRLLRAHRADGVVLMAVGTGAGYAARMAHLLRIPAVLVDRRIPELALDLVATDGFAGTRAAVDHVLDLGHSRVGILTGPPGVSAADERLAGYRAALGGRGIAFDPALVRTGEFRQEPAYAATRALMAGDGRPTAIFACNNLMAIGMMRALSDLGLACPEDVSVACFDDFDWANAFRPRLTTVAQPTEAIGAAAVELLLDRLGGAAPAEPRRVMLPARLVVRDSCAPPRC
ncbi:MAG: LacI family DNA-binding transcriptional regulator [Alphaproteobacteria bacterium]